MDTLEIRGLKESIQKYTEELAKEKDLYKSKKLAFALAITKTRLEVYNYICN